MRHRGKALFLVEDFPNRKPISDVRYIETLFSKSPLALIPSPLFIQTVRLYKRLHYPPNKKEKCFPANKGFTTRPNGT